MPKGFILVALLSVATSVAAQEPDWGALTRAKETALQCASPNSFSALFALADSDGFMGADSQEALSEANEDAFLRCPIEFLQGLKQQSPSARSKIIKFYFGVHHESWELGAILNRLQKHPEVGDLVKREFGDYLRAKAPFEK